jgi:hypothetical protein
MNHPNQVKDDLLVKTAQNILQECAAGRVARASIYIQRIATTPGLRVGRIDLKAGHKNGPLYSALAAHEAAALRHLIAWRTDAVPMVSIVGTGDQAAVSVEVPWPDDMAMRDIPLSGVRLPKPTGRDPDLEWWIGPSQFGGLIGLSLCDETPHILIVGVPGAGKSVILQSLIAQVAGSDMERLVILLDAKGGRAIKRLGHARWTVGPVAHELLDIHLALRWIIRQMHDRYDGGQDTRQIILVADELSDITQDKELRPLFEQVLQKGREARINIVAATHHPTTEVLSSLIARMFTARIALRVQDQASSTVATGDPDLHAHRLLPRGDCLVITAAGRHSRVQAAYLDRPDQVPTWPHLLDEWPADPEAALPERWPSPAETVHSIAAALHPEPEGRKKLEARLQSDHQPIYHANRMQELVDWGRKVVDEMTRLGLSVCLSAEETLQNSA